MRKSLLFLWLAGCSSTATVEPEIAGSAVRAWHHRLDSESLVRVEITPVAGHPDVVAALCDFELDWWGYFGVYHLTDGRVDWQAQATHVPGEHSILRVRTLQLPSVAGPVIEVLGKTHLGNGNLYLYELRERRLILLLETRAVDFHWADGETFRDGHLEPDYRDVNGDGLIDVVLSGELEEWDEDLEGSISSWPYRRVALWDRSRGRFE
jgi:hypothetical protein